MGPLPVMSMPLADGILSRWALVPNITASGLAGLRSSPFSKEPASDVFNTFRDCCESVVSAGTNSRTTACRQRIDGGPDCVL